MIFEVLPLQRSTLTWKVFHFDDAQCKIYMKSQLVTIRQGSVQWLHGVKLYTPAPTCERSSVQFWEEIQTTAKLLYTQQWCKSLINGRIVSGRGSVPNKTRRSTCRIREQLKVPLEKTLQQAHCSCSWPACTSHPSRGDKSVSLK